MNTNVESLSRIEYPKELSTCKIYFLKDFKRKVSLVIGITAMIHPIVLNCLPLVYSLAYLFTFRC